MNASRNKARLAPIIVALLVLVSISLLGFIVASWPAEPPAAAPQVRGEAPPPDRHEVARDSLAPPTRSPPRAKWM